MWKMFLLTNKIITQQHFFLALLSVFQPWLIVITCNTYMQVKVFKVNKSGVKQEHTFSQHICMQIVDCLLAAVPITLNRVPCVI